MNSNQNDLVFKIHKDGFNDLRKMVIRRSLPIGIIALASGVVMGAPVTAPKQLDTQTLLLCLGFGVFALGIGLIRGLKKQKLLLDTYTLTVSNEKLVREQVNTPTIIIDRSQVTQIVKHKNGSYLVKGEMPLDAIIIPRQVENYEVLEKTLKAIHPITYDYRSAYSWIIDHILPFVTIALMICVFSVNHKAIVALSGIILIALMTWSFIKTRSSKNVDDKTKRSMWWVVFVLFFVVLTVVYKLGGLSHGS
jgi:hypothetical protein